LIRRAGCISGCFGVFWARENARETPQKQLLKRIKLVKIRGNFETKILQKIHEKSGEQTLTNNTTCECCGRVVTNFKRVISRKSPKNIHKSKD